MERTMIILCKYSLEGIMHACISVLPHCFTRALVGFQWGH